MGTTLLVEGVLVVILEGRYRIFGGQRRKMTGKTCEKCHSTISGRTVTFQEKAFHPECFICHQCRQELKGSIRQHEGHNYCESCYGSTHAKKCGKCFKALTETGVQFVVYGEQSFHKECFTCARCRETLSGKKFYQIEDEGKVCEGCYER